MCSKQIIKDFEELYPGKNQKKLLEEYYRQKKKEQITVLAALLFLFLLIWYSDNQSLSLKEGNHLIRSTSEQKEQEVSLNVKRGENNWEEFSFLLSPIEYSEEELEAFYDKLIEELPEYYLEKNESSDQILFSLNFPDEIEGYPFNLLWKSYNREVINHLGEIVCNENKEDIPVEIGLTVSYGNWEREHRFYVTVIKKDMTDKLYLLKEWVQREEENTREEEIFSLPERFLNEELTWKYKGKNRSIFVILCLFPLMLILWYQRDKEIAKRVEKRRRQLKREYPDFVNRLVLYLGVGISIRESMFQIQKELERKKGQRENILFEEINYICIQMKNGLPEKMAYEILGKRCSVSEYRKLMALLIQYLEKGSSKLLESLEKEAENSRDEQFKQMRKIGEEMGTKLLFPMMLLLGLVIVLIMIPAFYSFQI